jgi:hypothetical protein
MKKLLCLVALAAPLLMGPGSTSCPTCTLIERWKATLAPEEMRIELQVVRQNEAYRVELLPTKKAALDISGPVEDLNCERTGVATICNFVATEDAKVSLKVSAGSSKVDYELQLLSHDKT